MAGLEEMASLILQEEILRSDVKKLSKSVSSKRKKNSCKTRKKDLSKIINEAMKTMQRE